MKALDDKLLKQFLRKASEKLSGDWILVGGTLLAAVGLNVRSTVDIDIVSLEENGNDETLKLMEIAEDLGLGVETINSAAALFVRRAAPRQSDLLLLQKGKRARIFRPSVFLYWKLKLPRLSETDLLDCQYYLNFCRSNKDEISLRELRQLLEAQLSVRTHEDRAARLARLRESLESIT